MLTAALQSHHFVYSSSDPRKEFAPFQSTSFPLVFAGTAIVRQKGTHMFGHMKAQPILKLENSSSGAAIAALLAITEGARPVRWMEFPASILLFVSVEGDPESGAFYVFDRKTSTWFWIDFDDLQYGGYSANDFDLLIHEYDILALVERPGLLKATPGWILEPGKPAEMAALCK